MEVFFSRNTLENWLLALWGLKETKKVVRIENGHLHKRTVTQESSQVNQRWKSFTELRCFRGLVSCFARKALAMTGKTSAKITLQGGKVDGICGI